MEFNLDREYKRTEAILYKYKDIQRNICYIDRLINDIKTDTKGVGNIDYSKDRLSQSYNISNPIEKELLEKERRIEQLEKDKKRLQRYIDCINIALNNLTEEHRIVFDMWYKNNKQYTRYAITQKLYCCKEVFYKLRQELVYAVIEALHPEQTIRYLERQFFI